MTDDQLQPLPEVVRPSLVPSGSLRGATIQPRAQHIRTYGSRIYSFTLPVFICVANHYIFSIGHTMTDGQLPSVPEVVPSTLVPPDHSRGATIHPRSQPMRTYFIYIIVKHIDYICVVNHYIFFCRTYDVR